MTDEKVDKSVSIEHGGKTIHFCCKMCVKKFRKDPAKYSANLPFKIEIPETKYSALHSVTEFTGRFHPLLIHFPIVLILLVSFLEFKALLLKTEKPVTINLLLATLIFCVFAMTTGLCNGYSANIPDEMELYEEFHKYIGIAISIIISLLYLLARKTGKKSRLYYFLLGLCAILVTAGAHLGGSLVYGPDYLF